MGFDVWIYTGFYSRKRYTFAVFDDEISLNPVTGSRNGRVAMTTDELSCVFVDAQSREMVIVSEKGTYYGRVDRHENIRVVGEMLKQLPVCETAGFDTAEEMCLG